MLWKNSATVLTIIFYGFEIGCPISQIKLTVEGCFFSDRAYPRNWGSFGDWGDRAAYFCQNPGFWSPGDRAYATILSISKIIPSSLLVGACQKSPTFPAY
jgi:hypothetical protein